MARDDAPFWNDPEIVARSDARRDHAMDRALRVPTEDPVARYAHAYTRERRDLRIAERRAKRGTWMPDIGFGDLVQRVFARRRRSAARVAAVPVARRTRGAGRALVRGIAVAGALALAVPLVGVLALTGYAALRWSDISLAVAIAEQQMACARVTAMTGADGRILAYEPLVDAATCAARRSDLAMSFEHPDQVRERPGLTVPFALAVEAAVVPALTTIEGAIAGFPETLFGHDWRGPVRFVAAAFGLLNGERGASGPLLSAFESLIGHPQSMPLRHKPVTFIAASVFAARHLPDVDSRARFVATFMPAVRGRGYPLAGRLAADALFGHDPQTLAERCLFARAMGTPVVLPFERADVGDAAGLAWGSVLGPATRRCVRELATSLAEAEAALADLDAWCGGDAICAQPGLEPDRAARAERLAAIARTQLPIAPNQAQTSPDARRPMLDGLRLAGDWQPGTAIATTVDRDAQAALDQTLPGALSDLAARLPAGLCFDADCSQQATYSVAAIELTPDGPLYRAGRDSHHGQFFGPVWRGDEGYVQRSPDWGLGSIRKSVLALVAARHGYEALCALPDGDSACTGGTWVALDTALGRSDNAPFEWLVHHHMAEVYDLLDAIGAVPASRPATPAQIVLDTIRHAPPAAYASYLAALFSDQATPMVRVGQTAPGMLDLAALGYDAETRARARQALAAPIAGGGTLQATAGAAAVADCRAIGGKSGTHATGPVNIVKASILVWRCGGAEAPRTLITFVGVSSAADDITLGALRHTDLASLHRAALAAVTTR